MSRLKAVLEDSSPPVSWAPRWKEYLALGLSLLGFGISIYLTIVHLVGTQILACSGGSSVVNCAEVTTSAQSHFLGLPVSELGLGFYFVMVLMNLPWTWHIADRRVHLLRLVLIVVGILFALYLVSAELLIIGKICEWCTGVHIVTFFLMVLLVSTIPQMLGWGGVPSPEDD